MDFLIFVIPKFINALQETSEGITDHNKEMLQNC